MLGRPFTVDHDNPAGMAGDLIAGRYRLLEPLGRGAMSAVWLAHDGELDRNVAIKTLAPSADRARFEREAHAVAALSHPNICSVYDYGESEGRPFMVLECLPNGSLEDRLAGGEPLPDDEVQLVAGEIAAGLAHAHERGLVHRDLKPANVLFDIEGRAKIADFGIARMGGAGTLTEAGTVLGTASYISPEQASGRAASPASDVYSFGVILFRMLTGALPFVSTNPMELVRMHRDDPPPAVADLRADAPPQLERIADASLAKDPAARPTDGAALVAALGGGAMPAAAATAAATQVLPPAGRPRRRLPVLPLAVLAAVLLGGGIALGLAVTRGNDAPASPPPGLHLPNVSTAGSTTQIESTAPTPTVSTNTLPATTRPTTTAHTTTHRVTTVPPPTTVPTTLPTTAPTLPTTTSLPPTTSTIGTTTIAITTDATTPATTAATTTTTTP
jgi:eukaryotic-like serine/threonine-protein kinase